MKIMCVQFRDKGLGTLVKHFTFDDDTMKPSAMLQKVEDWQSENLEARNKEIHSFRFLNGVVDKSK